MDYFNYALSHALRTACIARTLGLLDADQEVQRSSLLSEISGNRTYILSGAKLHGQAIKERMVLGYIENQIAPRWKELDHKAHDAQHATGQKQMAAQRELLKAKARFLRAHHIEKYTNELALPTREERLYIALWEGMQDTALMAPTSGSYGISCFQIIRHLREFEIRMEGHVMPLLVRDQGRGGAMAFIPAAATKIMPINKFGALKDRCHDAGCPAKYVVEWENRSARDVMALLQALVMGGIFAPTNPKSPRELKDILTSATEPENLAAKRLTDAEESYLITALMELQRERAGKVFHALEPIDLPKEVRRLLGRIDQTTHLQIQQCIRNPQFIQRLNRNSEAVEEVNAFRRQLSINIDSGRWADSDRQEVLSYKLKDNDDLLFSPQGIKALNQIGVHVYDFDLPNDQHTPEHELRAQDFKTHKPEHVVLEVTRPLDMGLYGLMVPRLQHLEKMLLINDTRLQNGKKPIHTVTTYNQPSVGATLAGAALTDWILGSGAPISDSNMELLHDLFPCISDHIERYRKKETDKVLPFKLKLVATPDTASLQPDSLAKKLGYKGPDYKNDGIPANGLGTLTPGELPMMILEAASQDVHASIAKGSVIPAPDALMEVGRLILFVSDIYLRTSQARDIAQDKGMIKNSPQAMRLMRDYALKSRYPEDAAAASTAGWMLEHINRLYDEEGEQAVGKFAKQCADLLFTFGLTRENVTPLLPLGGRRQLINHAKLHGGPLPIFIKAFLTEMERDPKQRKTIPAHQLPVDETHVYTFYDTGRNGPEISQDVNLSINALVRTMASRTKELWAVNSPTNGANGAPNGSQPANAENGGANFTGNLGERNTITPRKSLEGGKGEKHL
jgi:hypothetical protein